MSASTNESRGGRLKLAVEGPLSSLSLADRTRLVDRRPSGEPELREQVAAILGRVRKEGDAVLREMAAEFDEVDLDDLEIPRASWDEAMESLDPSVRAGLEEAASNIRRFHEALVPAPIRVPMSDGIVLGRNAVPLKRAGVYAPGGRASYPSSVLMGVVPAVAAGVEEIVVCSPPGSDGLPPAETLAACAIAGASRLFALGGAGAVGALAYGTESVPRVDVIVGPGNRWVTEAKRQVAGELPIDGPAGPSEVLVVAEEGSADPVLIVGELVAQAEHDPDACVAFVTPSSSLLADVREALAAEVAATPRRDVVEAALATNGALLLADSLDQALAFAEAYAAEHLALYTSDPRRDLVGVRTSGTVFLGEAASVAFGDYLTGANHVLPTAGRARSFSGLSTEHFLRAFTWQEVSEEAAARMSPTVQALAGSEGLPAHARAASLRGRTATEGRDDGSADGRAAGVEAPGEAP